MTAAIPDASVAVKWLVAEAGSDRAARLLDGRALHVPNLFYVETANALWAMTRRGAIPGAAAAAGVGWLTGAPLTRHDEAPGLIGRAHRIAAALAHPVHDCVYLALAVEIGAPVVTADHRFARAATADSDLAALIEPLSGAGA